MLNGLVEALFCIFGLDQNLTLESIQLLLIGSFLIEQTF